MSKESYMELAKKILGESLKLREGENITVETWNNGLPFANEVVLEAKKIGARPLLILEDEKTFIEATKTVPGENLGKMGDHEYALLSETDAYVFIPGPPIGGFTTQVTDEARTAATSYNTSWYEAATKAKLRGVRLSFGYIGKDIADLLGKKESIIVNHLIDASLCNFREIKRKADGISKKLADGTDAIITSEGGKLEFQFMGKLGHEDGVVDDGDIREERNIAYIPPGWVSKEADTRSINGTVRVDAPLTKYGKITDVALKFKDGELTGWGARGGEDSLNLIMDRAPQGVKTIMSVGIGLNPVLKYGYSQDRFVAGATGVTFGVIVRGSNRRSSLFSGVISGGTMSSAGKRIVEKGRLV